MTSVQHHVVTQSHSSTNHLDNHLDALLDDLQTTISRPGTSLALSTQNGPIMNGSSFGGHINLPPGASGYREITTTVTRDTNGVPMTSREYQIEYLNPANSVTVLDERSSSPAMDFIKNADLAGHQVQSYKTEVYDYKYSKTTSDKKMTTTGGFPNQRAIEDGKTHYQEKPQIQDGAQYSRAEDTYRSESSSGRNLNELDMLLKELNTSPGDSRTTPRREQVHTVETRMERNSGRYPESPATMPKRSASATREVTFTQEMSQNRGGRAHSPSLPSESSRSPGRTINVRREYNTMESSGRTSRRDSPSTRNRSAEMSPTLRRRTPSPSSGEFRPSNFSNYPISPKDLTPTRTVTTKSYNYSTSSRRTPTPSFDEPQPYRSPSPVSFPQKRSPSPHRRSLNRSDSGRNVSYQVSGESPAVASYKYASHSREQSRYSAGGRYEERDCVDPVTRPFPSSTPIPVGDQNPPKKLDDLMASFEESRISARSPEFNRGTGEYTHKIEIARETHDGGLQRSPSFERNLRPSNVKVSQTYSQQQQQQQQQGQEYHNQYQQREQHPGSYHKEYQRREEYHTSSTSSQQNYPGQFQNPPQQYPRDTRQKEHYQQQQQYQTQQYQQNQTQQYQQNQGGYQKEQYNQNQSHQYQQNQQYQYQKHQQFHHHQQQQQQHQQLQQQQHSSQNPVSESMSATQGYRTSAATRSVAGPPVYYPPGVELFTKKEEAMLNQEQSSGGKKGKSKSKSEKGKGKGVTGVPMCLPVCCAAPCSIM